VSLFSELKRRNVLRVGAAYVALAWLVIQVTETLFPVFGLSDAAIRGVVIVLAIGFVPAVVSAWAFELTPEGLIRDSEVDRASPKIKAMGKRLDRLFMVALALALGYFAIDKFMLDPARDRAREQAIAEVAREEGRAEAERLSDARASEGPPMVAVLPFVAVGDTDESNFFATGVHDDLLTQLAQQQSMRVISRTSVLEYKDTDKKIRQIGEELRADAILEGGVQTAGERIRINAQLIDARTDEHLWAETFDRELTASNIFDVQTEIAQAIATALHGTLATPVETGAGLIPTSNMAAYRLFHESLTMRDSGHGVIESEEYRNLLREAAELDPGYTRPQAELVGSLSLDQFHEEDPALLEEAERVLANIAAVAPGSADHLIAQAYYTYYVIKDYDLAHEIATQALALTPSDARLAEMRSWIERRQGNYEAFIESRLLVRSLDPRNPRWTRSLISALIQAHRYDEARAEIESLENPGYSEQMMGVILRARDHRDPSRVAADLTALQEDFDGRAPPHMLIFVRTFARDYDGALEALATVPDPAEGDRPPRLGVPDKLMTELQIRWLMGDDERVATLLPEAQAILESRVPDGSHRDARVLLGEALLATYAGEREKVEQLVRRWYREGAQDWAERIGQADLTCQILAMAGAAEAAVECLRTALANPSYVTPFLEPYMSFYDGIREEPAFVELVAELESQER
jgi:TolB-like protein